MRVTSDIMSRTMTDYLLSSRSAVFELQKQISSGRRVNRPSDDPSSYSLIAQLKDDAACATQFLRNLERLDASLKTMDSKTEEILEIQHRLSELIVTAGDNTHTPEDRESLGKEVDQLLEDMVGLANTSVQGSYIFGGLRSEVQPYVATRDADGMITAITYQGSAETHMVEIGHGVYVPDNIPGTEMTGNQAVFQNSETDIFADMINLRDRLMEGDNPVQPMPMTVDAASNILSVRGTYHTGALVKLETNGTLPGGLSPNTKYYAIEVGPGQIRLATSLDNARNGVFIDITNTGTGEHGASQDLLTEAQRNIDHIMIIASRIGAYEERVNTNRKILMTTQDEILNALEDEESVDVAKAITEMQSQQLAYEAALKITSTMMSTSLMNYM